MNTVQLVGRLTKEVELKFTGDGTAIGTFNLAVNRNFTNSKGEKEADFIRCVIWRKAAENLANFTRKGSLIGVEGRIQTRNYDNEQGQKVYITEIVVSQFHLLEPKSQDNNNQEYQQPNNYQQGNQGYAQNQGYQQQNNNYQQANQGYAQSNNYQQPNNFQQTNNSPFMEDGSPVEISEDDLPFNYSPVR